MRTPDLFYRILGVSISVHCPSPELQTLLTTHWGRMSGGQVPCDLAYTVARDPSTSAISIARPGQATKWTVDEGEFLYELEADASLALQRIRSDLYFIHAAVAEIDGRAALFVAKSGGGKSTTLWGLLHHGWGYMSDELAPIDVASLHVHAYPRALCLKRQPPSDFPLPDATLITPRTMHVAVEHLPHVSVMDSCPLAAIYFVNHCPDTSLPAVRAISPGEAGARLYANTLNQLAHANAGLDAAISIAQRVPSFLLDTADLGETCVLLKTQAI